MSQPNTDLKPKHTERMGTRICAGTIEGGVAKELYPHLPKSEIQQICLKLEKKNKKKNK